MPYTNYTEILQSNTIKERSRKRRVQPRPKTRERLRAPKDQVQEVPHVLLGGDSDRPEASDETRVVLLPVDPYVIHAYWVISSDNLAKAKLLLGKDYERAEAILRFHDITYLMFNGSNAHSSFDIRVDLGTQNWYVHLWSPEKSYCADLGLRTEDGQFFPIARSNAAETPRARPSTRKEDCYMLIEGNYRHIEQISVRVGKGPAVIQHLIQTKESHKKRVDTHYPETGQAEEKGITNETGPFWVRGIGHDPIGKEELSKYRGLLSEQVLSIIRRFNFSLEGQPSVDLTEISERGFVSGLSSKVFDRPTKKIVA